MGSAGIACPALEALARKPDFEIVGVVTQPDRPRGRHLHPAPCPVKEIALAKGLPVLQPKNPNTTEFLQTLRNLSPELIVVAAYGHILSKELLSVPPFGCLNIHASLLPKYRGAAPIQWAIINDEQETGVTIMLIDEGLDTGPILAQARTAILPSDTAESLGHRLGLLGAELLIQTIPHYMKGTLKPVPQPAVGASYAPKIKKEHGKIDWAQSARHIWNRVRAFVPWPTAYTWFKDRDSSYKLLKVWKAEVIAEIHHAEPGTVLAATKQGIDIACGEHILRITELQVEGSRRMSAPEFFPGRKIQPGDKLGLPATLHTTEKASQPSTNIALHPHQLTAAHTISSDSRTTEKTMQISINQTIKTGMVAVRLHGPQDLRVEKIPLPGKPGPGEVLLRVTVTTICGSDLHSYLDASIGGITIKSPLILGHEFAGVIEEVGPNAVGGDFRPLAQGMRVAVDPAMPCWHCEMCEQGNPNLCLNLQFCGTYPTDGSLCEYKIMPARSCFPLPDNLDDTQGALLEALGVAIHAIDLAKIKVGDRVAILGAGPIGLLILQLARLAGATRALITDKLQWRLNLAQKYGGEPINVTQTDPVKAILAQTNGLGVDVAIEAAWADETVAQTAEIVRPGGRVVLVGIPRNEMLVMRHAAARRKGLTIRLCRRMKHCYPRAIELASTGKITFEGIVTHRFPLHSAPEAFKLNAAYTDGVIKVAILNESRP